MSQSSRITVDGCDIFVEDHDFVQPWRSHGAVLMQHGFCRNGRFFSPWVPYIGKDYRVLRPDLRGHGFSGDPGVNYRFSLDRLTDDLIGVLDALEIDSVHYVGESFGSVIGVAAAAAHPDRFKTLNLCHVPTELTGAGVQAQSIGHSSWQDALRDLGVEKWWIQARTATDDLTGDTKADDYSARQAGLTPVHVACEIARLARDLDLTAALKRLVVPTQFHISGRYSYTTSVKQQQGLLELVPHSSLIVHKQARARTFFPFFDVELVAPPALAFMKQVDAQQNPQG